MNRIGHNVGRLVRAVFNRSVFLAAALVASFGVMSYGAWLAHPPLGYITGGMLGAVWSWLVLAEVGDE